MDVVAVIVCLLVFIWALSTTPFSWWYVVMTIVVPPIVWWLCNWAERWSERKSGRG